MKNSIPLSWILSGSVSANRRAAMTLLNQLVRPGVLLLLACLCFSAHAQTGEWTWMDGSNTVTQFGVYGTLGTPAAGNFPGGREGAASWTDSSGNLWLFGGWGDDGSSVVGSFGTTSLNDLWEFYTLEPHYVHFTNEWIWWGGSSAVPNPYQSGVYGTQGKPAPACAPPTVLNSPASPCNIPGTRMWASSWTDSHDNLWLFGGYGNQAMIGNTGTLNDLWEFTPSTNEWTWIGGSSTVGGNCVQANGTTTCGWSGVYGTLGTPAAGNFPGSHEMASSWTDIHGNLWLFGGQGYDTNGNQGNLNELWEFNPQTNQWTWMGGSNTVGSKGGQSGVYGTLGTPAAGNVPGGRNSASNWIDSSGHFWLFGGAGVDINGDQGNLNDLWEFNPQTNQWTWMGGSNTVGSNGGQSGVYGTMGTPAAGNVPGGRNSASNWIDSSGRLWLFGGFGYDAAGNYNYLNDLWMFNPSTNEWTWMGGSNTINLAIGGQPGVYGTLGTPAAGNVPGSRWAASSWTDSSGNLWLFGGSGLTTVNGGIVYLNDLWKYQPAPYVVTDRAVLTAPLGARLNASVDNFGQSAQVWFKYGTNSAQLKFSTQKATLPASNAIQLFSTSTKSSKPNVKTTPLNSNTTYYYQAWATTAVGTSHGAIKSFKTK
jgi:N-acetylneuraminic acid mutarotase